MDQDPAVNDDPADTGSETSPSGYRTKPTSSTGMPAGVPYIIGNEAAERFSFYGMKSILTVFMVDYLHRMGDVYNDVGMSNAEATEHYHTFTAAVYFTPIAGALLADILFGKYRTILWLSIVYCLGHGALALMGSPPMTAGWWLFAGLFLISVGSGGIKPCVSAHVGDQFGKANKHLLTKVYQWFYFSINFGSFISTFLIPWLLEHYGPHWAFGIPGVLMAIATLLFWMGRNRFIHIPPGRDKFVRELFSATGLLTVAKLMIIFSFVAIFWALFDQTGSSWVLQAKNLNRNLFGWTVLESQIQALNPILVLLLIPTFQFGIYPAIDRFFPLTPIRKISLGLFVMIGGFAIIAWLQNRVDLGGEPSIAWQFLAYGVLTASEVMVSITCLEFAYTQAPKSMKSVVMAVFLFSVSLGNFFTAAVNKFIQTSSASQVAALVTEADLQGDLNGEFATGEWTAQLRAPEQASDDVKAELLITGLDGESGSDDDIVVSLTEKASIESIRSLSTPALNAAADRIEAEFFKANETLPDEAAGQTLIADVVDAHDNPITYRVVSRDAYELTSPGADKIEMTAYDEVMSGSIDRVSDEPSDGDSASSTYFNWLERRRIELQSDGDASKAEDIKQEILSSRGQTGETSVSRSFSVGGRTKLSGASYFWFWTACIAVTAVLFVPVGYLYREKTYIQDEDEDADERDAEAAADTVITGG
ncbi:MAG: POT family MFS transporter [Planctomycetota bacterium]